MSCPSSIYTVLTNYSATAGEQIPLGVIVRRYGRGVQLDGPGINLVGSGYFDIDASLTFVPTSTGAVTIQFYQDGSAIPGAVATAQGTASEPVSLPVSSQARNCGCACSSTLTCTVSAAGTVSNLSTRVKKS